MKQFIISLSICLLINLLGKNTLIGHFSLFYIQVMILFVIDEINLRWNENLDYWRISSEDVEIFRLYKAVELKCPQLRFDIAELGSLVFPKDLPLPRSAQLISPIIGQPVQQSFNFNNEDIGIAWLVARGYTADKLDELIEDMPRMLMYLKNVQNAKAIEAL